MARQLDEEGAALLKNEIEKLGIRTILGRTPKAILGQCQAEGMAFVDGPTEDGLDMVIFAAGIKPRDEIANISGIDVHPRGGVIVDDSLRTSVDDIYAI